MLFAEKIPTLVVVGVVLASLGTAVAQKPGLCPAFQGAGPCIITCHADNDCTGDMKCCANGCGLTCQPPDNPGICPAPDSFGIICLRVKHSCDVDGDCSDGNKKCCMRTTCGRTCVAPECENVQNGTCGNGLQCPTGTTCMFKGDGATDTGKCCKDETNPLDVCKLQKDVGSCPRRPFLLRYYYNTVSCKCETFGWNTCGGNANRFNSLAECKSTCEEPIKSYPVCEQPKMPGPCAGFTQRWWYNKDTCKCEKFKYGGCQGNSNNFEDERSCYEACNCHGSSETCTEPPNCALPRDPGNTTHCAGRKQKRVYFDPVKCKCKYFRYSGCGGNSNNFQKLKECKKSCAAMDCPVCRLPRDPGPCNLSLPRFFYNIQTCMCEQFNYGGCGGNANRYETAEDCSKVCGSFGCPICNQHKAGACKKFQLKWYFDATKCECKPFLFGGCAGNRNRFSTREDCEGSCGSFECPVCTQPMRKGPCNKSIRRFYYDPLQNNCKVFKWGGCDPNGNNFNNKKSCAKICRGSICSLPLKNGPCIGGQLPVKRFYYDSAIGMCQEFLWKGCDSNGNNFKSKRRCKSVCEKK